MKPTPITIPAAFRRDEPPDRTAARGAALLDRCARIDAQYGHELNRHGMWLVRRAAFAAYLSQRS